MLPVGCSKRIPVPHLTIRERRFKVTDFVIGAAISDPKYARKYERAYAGYVGWHFEADTDSRVFEGEHWSPRFYCEIFVPLLNDWEELDGLTFENDYDASRADTIIRNPCVLYVFGHDAMGPLTFRFARTRKRIPKFRMTVQGFCNPHWDEEYGSDVPFAFDADFVFGGINVTSHTVETATELLAQQMNVENLIAGPETDTELRFKKEIGTFLFSPRT